MEKAIAAASTSSTWYMKVESKNKPPVTFENDGECVSAQHLASCHPAAFPSLYSNIEMSCYWGLEFFSHQYMCLQQVIVKYGEFRLNETKAL